MKSIIESLNVRLKSPLIFSFLIAWPFWNWEIMVGLIWYDSTTLAEYVGIQNYFDFIKKHSTPWRSFWGPFISALVYTFLFPLIKWGITAFNTIITTKEETQALKISKKGFIPTLKYVESYNEAQEHIKTLSDMIQKESEKLKEIDELNVENSKLKLKLNHLQSEMKRHEKQLDLLKKYTDIKFLDGTWNLNFKVSGVDDYVNVKVRIREGSIPPEVGPQSNLKFRIENVSEFFMAENNKAVLSFKLNRDLKNNESKTYGNKMFNERTIIDVNNKIGSLLEKPIICQYHKEESSFVFYSNNLNFKMQRVE